jgi:hypothetical protein
MTRICGVFAVGVTRDGGVRSRVPSYEYVLHGAQRYCRREGSNGLATSGGGISERDAFRSQFVEEQTVARRLI